MTSVIVQNRTYAEIQPGDSASLSHKLTERDIRLFAAVSGDRNPTHLGMDNGSSPRLTAHAMWGASLISGLLGNELPGPGTVYRSQQLQFQRPLHLDDSLTVTLVVREKRDPNIVVFDCHGLDRHGETVFSGVAEVYAPAHKEQLSLPEVPLVAVQQHDLFEGYIQRCQALAPMTTAVAHPCDESSLASVVQAARQGLMTPILVGPVLRIRALAQQLGLDISGFELVDMPHSEESAERAVALVREGRAEVLMKGSLHTDELMAAVVARNTGLRTDRRISHVFVMDVPTYHKALFVTDAAVNIAPTLEDKVDIAQNAIDLALALGLKQPKLAILAAVETVNSHMPSTTEAAALCKMADRGQIRGGLLDGPLAMDNAISKVAAQIKHIKSEVAGDADILLVPDLEAGNILAKQLSFMANADAAGIVLGAKAPIILTSRADSERTKLASVAVALLLVASRRHD